MEQLNFLEKLEESNKPICPVCGNSFEKKYSRNIYCTIQCYHRDYYKKNKKHISSNSKKWKINNKDKCKLYDLKWKINNREKIKKGKRIRYSKNKNVILEQNIKSLNKKLKEDENYKIRHNLKKNLSRRIRNALTRSKTNKFYKTFDLLGCNISEAKEHLEKQFKEGMIWENHGTHGWHIDHIIPCASFDLTYPEQQKKCFHYTNLQPLWAKENMSKGSNII
jgi:hypothetical protein